MRHLHLYNNSSRHHTEWTRALKIYILPDHTHGMAKKLGAKYQSITMIFSDMEMGFHWPLAMECIVLLKYNMQDKLRFPVNLLCNDSELNVLKAKGIKIITSLY